MLRMLQTHTISPPPRLSAPPSFPPAPAPTRFLAMDNSLNIMAIEQNPGGMDHLFGLYPGPCAAFSDAPFFLDPFHDSGTFPPMLDQRRQDAAFAAPKVHYVSPTHTTSSLETLSNELGLISGFGSSNSSPSSYSQDSFSPNSMCGADIESAHFTSSPAASQPGGNDGQDSSQLTDFGMSNLDDDLLRPFATPYSTPYLPDNSLHLFVSPSGRQDLSETLISPGNRFNPQFTQPLPSYPSPGSMGHRSPKYIGSQGVSTPTQPEQFYPTPTSTPHHGLASLPPHPRAQAINMRSSPSPSIPLERTRPVRAAAAAAKRRVSYAVNDDEADEFEAFEKPTLKRRKATTPIASARSKMTSRITAAKRTFEKRKKIRKDLKVIWEEDRTVDPGVPVELNGKVIEGCQWGVPVYAVCQAGGARSIRWRCTSCSALLGRRPDLHRHWKSCVENAIFVCDEVIHKDGSVWPGCGTICSRQDAARRHIERRFRNGHCSLIKPNKSSFPEASAYEQRLAVYNNMVWNSAWRAALPVGEKNRLAHSALGGMKTDIFKE